MAVRWWKKLFSEAPPPPPLLIRVAEPSGSLPSAVDVEVTWYPSGCTGARRQHTAAGLCVIPWRADERSARISIRSGGAEAIVEVERDRPDAHRVHELALAMAGRPAMHG